MKILLLSLGLAAAQCTGTLPATLDGEWGGQHIGMVVTPTGAQIEYDCAHGRIDGALRLDDDGEFVATGVHVQEHGGPVREGEQVVERPARYRGRVRGSRMALRVELTDSAQTLGDFELQRGANPNVLKCL